MGLQWRARTMDGEWLDKPAAVARGFRALVEAVIELPNGAEIRMAIDPRRGEEMLLFTRHPVKVNGGSPHPEVPVLQITSDIRRPDHFVRLYLTPKGPVLSTADIYF